MRVVVSAVGRFYMYDLARELARRDCLLRLFTGYPRLRIDPDLRPYALTRPLFPVIELTLARAGLMRLSKLISRFSVRAQDEWVSRSLPDCDLVIALAQTGVKTFAVAHQRGIKTVCDRGSAHIVAQRQILHEEYALQGVRADPVPEWAVRRELAEYAQADMITVPSHFAYRTFVEQGVSPAKLAINPFGVDVRQFQPRPKPDSIFRVIYVGGMSLRKGVPYLLEAFAGAAMPPLPDFELLLVGGLQEEIVPWFHRYAGRFRHVGQVPQSALPAYYASASVFVIASVEDGFGLVVAQAMACGLPVVATANTGAAHTLFEDGQEGFIVPIRDPAALREQTLRLYHDPDLRNRMSANALTRISHTGGWDQYGARALEIFHKILDRL